MNRKRRERNRKPKLSPRLRLLLRKERRNLILKQRSGRLRFTHLRVPKDMQGNLRSQEAVKIDLRRDGILRRLLVCITSQSQVDAETLTNVCSAMTRRSTMQTRERDLAVEALAEVTRTRELEAQLLMERNVPRHATNGWKGNAIEQIVHLRMKSLPDLPLQGRKATPVMADDFFIS